MCIGYSTYKMCKLFAEFDPLDMHPMNVYSKQTQTGMQETMATLTFNIR